MAQGDLFSGLNRMRNMGRGPANFQQAANANGIDPGRQLRDLQSLLNVEMQIGKVKKKNRDIDFATNGLIKGMAKMMKKSYEQNEAFLKNKKAVRNIEKDLLKAQKQLSKEQSKGVRKNQDLVDYLEAQTKEMEYQARFDRIRNQQMKRMLPMGGKLSGIMGAIGKGGRALNGTLQTVGSVLDGIGGLFDLILAPIKLIGSLLARPYNLFLQIQSITGNLAADIGLTSKETYKLKNDFAGLAIEALRFGGSMEDVATIMATFSNETNRNRMFDKESIGRIIELAYATGLGVEGASEMAASFENIGLSLEKTVDISDKARQLAAKFNLNSTKALQTLNNFVKQFQGYDFKNGITGLNKMVAQAQSLRFDLTSMKSIADKIFEPEGAIEAAAQLQVLGGKFAEMADPFQLMYAAQNAPELLAENLMKVTKGMAKRGKDGIFTISPMDRKIISEAANSLGMNADNLINAAIEQGKMADKLSANKFLRSGLFSEDDRMAISNLMRFDDKKKGYVIRMPDGFERLVSEIPSGNEFKRILDERKKNEEAAIERKNWAERLNLLIEKFMIGFTKPFQKIEGIFKNSNLMDKIEGLGTTIAEKMIPFIEDIFKPDGKVYQFIDSFAVTFGKVMDEVKAIFNGEGTLLQQLGLGLKTLFEKVVSEIVPYIQIAFGKLFEAVGNALPEWVPGKGSMINSGIQMQVGDDSNSRQAQISKNIFGETDQSLVQKQIDGAIKSAGSGTMLGNLTSGIFYSLASGISGFAGFFDKDIKKQSDYWGDKATANLKDVFGSNDNLRAFGERYMKAGDEAFLRDYGLKNINTYIKPEMNQQETHVKDGVVTSSGKVIKYPKGELLGILSPQQNIESSGPSVHSMVLSGTIKLETPAGNTTLTLEDFKKAGIHLIASAIGHEQDKTEKGYGLNDSKDIKTTLAL